MCSKSWTNPFPLFKTTSFADAIWHSETLFSNGHGVSKYLLSRAVHDAGYKVVYTGEGSEEIFGGCVHFRADMPQHNAQGQDPAEVQRRGLDGLWGMYLWLDRPPKRRNETSIWWRHHDEYGPLPQNAGSCCHAAGARATCMP